MAEPTAAQRLRSALKLKGWKYRDLANAMGEDYIALSKRISLGKFSADFYLRALAAIEKGDTFE